MAERGRLALLDPTDRALLDEAIAAEPARKTELLSRVEQGEPVAYAVGFLRFRGQRFAIDRRAYITDPELTHLVDAVATEAAAIAARLGRPPRLLEFGVGAGTLAITLKLAHPDWSVAGIDIDASALEVARRNAHAHQVDVPLIESDYFASWPVDRVAPDVVFGDPPWGGAEDLYTLGRDADYYRQMPAKSAFPPGRNPAAIHDELIARIRQRHWPTRVILNYGVLPLAIVARSTAPLLNLQLHHPAPGLTIAIGDAI